MFLNIFNRKAKKVKKIDLTPIKRARKEELEQEIIYNTRKLYGNEVTLNDALRLMENDAEKPENLSLMKLSILLTLKNIVDEYVNILGDLKNDNI